MKTLEIESTQKVASHRALFEDLQSISRLYTGAPKLVDRCWLNQAYLDATVLVLPLNSGGTEVATSPIMSGTDWLKIKHPSAPLALYPDADGYVDSSAVISSFNTYLSTVKRYIKSEIQLPLIQLWLTEESAPPLQLLLTIPVDNKQQARIYYLIADGQGNWKRIPPETLVSEPDLFPVSAKEC